MKFIQHQSPGDYYEISAWTLNIKGYYDSSVIGERKVRRISEKQEGRRAIRYSYTIIYCPTEEDARQLASKISRESTIIPLWAEKPKPIPPGGVLY